MLLAHDGLMGHVLLCLAGVNVGRGGFRQGVSTVNCLVGKPTGGSGGIEIGGVGRC
jgi:hypothetical protein